MLHCVPVHVQVSGESKEPVSIVVEEWEESQEGGEKEESMDVSLSEPVDEPANPRLFERHLVVSECKQVCECMYVCACVCVRTCVCVYLKCSCMYIAAFTRSA